MKDIMFIVLGTLAFIGALLFADRLREIELEKRCLWPARTYNSVADPLSKTCFIIDDTKKVSTTVDCTAVLIDRRFQFIKHCFQ